MVAGERTTTAAAGAVVGEPAGSKASCYRIAGMSIEKTALKEEEEVHWRIRTVAVAVDLHRKETQIHYDIADEGEGAPGNWTAMTVELEREGLVAEVHLEGSWTKRRNQG